jgi:hypothetical protein
MWNPLEVMGRRGDTLIAHITPREAAILKALGGSGTMNPKTGYREFWSDSGDGGVGGSESGMGTGGDDSDGTGGADTSGGGLDAMGTADATTTGLGSEMGSPGAFSDYGGAYSLGYGSEIGPAESWGNYGSSFGTSYGLADFSNADPGYGAYQGAMDGLSGTLGTLGRDAVDSIAGAIGGMVGSNVLGALGASINPGLGLAFGLLGGALGNRGGKTLSENFESLTAPSMEDVASLTGTNTPGSGDASYAGFGSIGTSAPSIGRGFASMSTPMATGQQALDKRPFWASVAERGGGGGTLARLLP